MCEKIKREIRKKRRCSKTARALRFATRLNTAEIRVTWSGFHSILLIFPTCYFLPWINTQVQWCLLKSDHVNVEPISCADILSDKRLENLCFDTKRSLSINRCLFQLWRRLHRTMLSTEWCRQIVGNRSCPVVHPLKLSTKTPPSFWRNLKDSQLKVAKTSNVSSWVSADAMTWLGPQQIIKVWLCRLSFTPEKRPDEVRE